MKNGFTFLDTTKIFFASSEKSQQLLGNSDGFTQSLSTIDVAARLQDITATREKDYLAFAIQQARNWTPEEVAATQLILETVDERIRTLGLKLNFPAEIYLLKSTMKEEGSAAGYTRANYIVFGKTPSIDLFTHELFHIFSRYNPLKRDALYQTIHFRKCNRLSFPASFQQLKITNPDAPFIEHFLPVIINEKQVEVIFVTPAKKPFDKEPFFSYLQKKLMIVEGPTDDKRPKLSDQELILLDYAAVPDLVKYIGDNTNYNIHPEEVMADHFKLLLNGADVPTPSLLEAMKDILSVAN